MIAELLERRKGEGIERLAAAAIRQQLDQAFRLPDGQGLQHRGVDEAEDRGVRADAESERRDRREREARALSKDTTGVPHVPGELFDQAGPANIAALVLHLIEAAELEAGPPARVRLAHARPHVVRDLALDVIAQLGVELRFQATPAEQPRPPGHDASPSAVLMIKPIASVSRRQLSASVAMWVRPFRVSR